MKTFTREDLDLVAYEEKFKRCDRYLETGDLKLLVPLLSDVTCFSYLYFTLDGKPLKLYPYQDMILNDPHKRKIFRAANQIGKSLGFDAKAAHNLIWDHGFGHTEAIVSKTLPQSTDQMRRVKSLLANAKGTGFDVSDMKGQTDNMSVMVFDVKDDNGMVKYSNMLICTPATGALLGYSIHQLNLDEFEYWDGDLNYFYFQIAEPRTFATNGSITIFSNPNGADSFAAELEKMTDRNGDYVFHTYVFDFLDRPGNSRDKYEDLKKNMSRQQFESTVAAIRSISSKNYFTPEEIEGSYDPNENEAKMVGKQPFFFLDVGSKHDQCVLVGGYIEPDEDNNKFVHLHIPIIHVYPVGYPIARVVGSPVDSSDGWHHETSVKEHLAEWGKGAIPTFGVDVTGNSGIVPLLESVGVNAIDVTFSGPMKSAMYQRFKYYMEKKLLHRIKSKEFEYQASHLEVRKSQRGYLMIHHENEDDLDDVMDAVAGLISLTDDIVNVPITLEVI